MTFSRIRFIRFGTSQSLKIFAKQILEFRAFHSSYWHLNYLSVMVNICLFARWYQSVTHGKDGQINFANCRDMSKTAA